LLLLHNILIFMLLLSADRVSSLVTCYYHYIKFCGFLKCFAYISVYWQIRNFLPASFLPTKIYEAKSRILPGISLRCFLQEFFHVIIFGTLKLEYGAKITTHWTLSYLIKSLNLNADIKILLRELLILPKNI
jgi:hypothetical protein